MSSSRSSSKSCPQKVLLPSARTAFDSIYIVFELLDTDLSHLIRSKTKYDEVHIQVRRSGASG